MLCVNSLCWMQFVCRTSVQLFKLIIIQSCQPFLDTNNLVMLGNFPCTVSILNCFYALVQQLFFVIPLNSSDYLNIKHIYDIRVVSIFQLVLTSTYVHKFVVSGQVNITFNYSCFSMGQARVVQLKQQPFFLFYNEGQSIRCYYK